MHFYPSEIYGDIPKPDSFSELMNLSTTSVEWAGRVRVWRGQSDVSWPIDSSAYRRLHDSGPGYYLIKKGHPLFNDLIQRDNINESRVRMYEQSLLKRATYYGHHTFQSKELSDMNLLSRLQHHGAATRLLDVSTNMLVGLWFAVRHQPDKVGILFGISSGYTLDYTMGEIGEYETFMNKLSDEYPLLWESEKVTPRIAAQHSQFIISKILLEDHRGSITLPKEENAFIAIALSPEFKKQMLIMLAEIFDIHELTMFPDLDGFCSVNSANVHPYIERGLDPRII